MVDKNKLNRIKGVLSAKQGAEIPKFLNPSGPLQRLFYTMWDPNSQSHKFYLDGLEVTEQQFFNDKRVRKDFRSTYSPDNKGVKTNPTSINTPSSTPTSTPSQYLVDGIPMSKERYLANANFSPNTMYWDRVSGNTIPSEIQLDTPQSAAVDNPASLGSMLRTRVGASYTPPTSVETPATTPQNPEINLDARTKAYEMNKGPQGSMANARVGSTMAIPGDPGMNPNTAIERSATVNALANDPRIEARTMQETVAAAREKYKPLGLEGLVPSQESLNSDLKTQVAADLKAAQVTGLNTESEKSIQDNFSVYSKKKEAERAQTLKKNNTVGMAASLGTLAFTAIGDAFGSALSATDSNLTKGITAGYKGIQNVVSNIGPIGLAASTIMGIASATGDILQSMGGGTDQQSTLDKWMDSPLLSWNVGAINGFLGKKSDSFSIDLDTITNVGSSYGGTVDTLEDAVKKSGKKYGLFSSKSRKKANAAIAEAKAKQNLMGDISDTAADQRLVVSSMGEQAGLAYSMLSSGGYDLKYTYAAKHGGLLEWNPVDTLEWEPQIELNWELPTFKAGGHIDIIEELEWIPELQKEDKKSFEEWFNSIPEKYRASGYDYKKAYEVFSWDELRKHALDPYNNHLRSVSSIADEDGKIPFLKLGTLKDNKELEGEFDFYYNTPAGKEWSTKYDLLYIGDRYYYVPKKYKEGGSIKDLDVPEIEETAQKNVIPEGALHKNKHHMEHAEGLTKKGIPVIDEDGEQLAEIEHSEIIFTLEVTKKLEDYYDTFYSEKSSNKEKEQAALDAGKLLVYQILENTEDRIGLIDSCKKGGSLTFKKSTDDLIEEVLEWMPVITIIEEVADKPKKEPEKKSEKEIMKEAIKEVLVELLTK